MALNLNWYLAPVCSVDPESGYHPGEGDGSVCPGTLGGMVVHAYDPHPDDGLVPTTCLVGIVTDESGRAGWTAQTVQEAKDYFEAHYGVAPTDAQVS